MLPYLGDENDPASGRCETPSTRTGKLTWLAGKSPILLYGFPVGKGWFSIAMLVFQRCILQLKKTAPPANAPEKRFWGLFGRLVWVLGGDGIILNSEGSIKGEKIFMCQIWIRKLPFFTLWKTNMAMGNQPFSTGNPYTNGGFSSLPY